MRNLRSTRQRLTMRVALVAVVILGVGVGVSTAPDAHASLVRAVGARAAVTQGATPNAVTWQVQSSPNAAGDRSSKLADVACTSRTACLAVGYSYPNPCCTERRMVQRWDGHSWSIMNTPGPSGPDDESSFSGVACGSPTSCTAVGERQTPLIEHWNGSSWSVQSSPFADASLGAIACPSATSCFVAGERPGSGAHLNVPLVEHWDGTKWTAMTTSTVGAYDGFTAISCSSTQSCTAVGQASGSHNDHRNDGQPVVEHWNGKAWSVQTPFIPSGKQASFDDVSCPTATECLAVGWSWRTKPDQPDSDIVRLVERWNGSTWTALDTPAPSGQQVQPPYLTSVSCATVSQCVIAGGYVQPGGVDGSPHPLIERWNGHTWSIDTTVKRGDSDFASVQCGAPFGCIAVGSAYHNGFHTLIERAS